MSLFLAFFEIKTRHFELHGWWDISLSAPLHTDCVDSCIQADILMDAGDYQAESWSLTVEQKFCKKQDKRVIKRQDVIYGEPRRRWSHSTDVWRNQVWPACVVFWCRVNADGAPSPPDSAHHGWGVQEGDDGGGAAGHGSSAAGVPLSGPAAADTPRLLQCHEGAAARLHPAGRKQKLPHRADRRHPAPPGWFLWNSVSTCLFFYALLWRRSQTVLKPVLEQAAVKKDWAAVTGWCCQ